MNSFLDVHLGCITEFFELDYSFIELLLVYWLFINYTNALKLQPVRIFLFTFDLFFPGSEYVVFKKILPRTFGSDDNVSFIWTSAVSVCYMHQPPVCLSKCWTCSRKMYTWRCYSRPSQQCLLSSAIYTSIFTSLTFFSISAVWSSKLKKINRWKLTKLSYLFPRTDEQLDREPTNPWLYIQHATVDNLAHGWQRFCF